MTATLTSAPAPAPNASWSSVAVAAVFGALAWFDCEVESISEHGDHAIIVGRVVAAACTDGNPLLYFARHYHRLGMQLGEVGANR